MTSLTAQRRMAYEHADALVSQLWSDPVAAQREWDAELAALYAAVSAADLRDATARRAVLDGAPGSGSLRAAEEVLAGAPAPAPMRSAEGTPPSDGRGRRAHDRAGACGPGSASAAGAPDRALCTDPLDDAVVSAFVAAHRVASYALWLEVTATARLLVTRAGRTPSLPRRGRSRRATRDDGDGLLDDDVATELALAAGITVGMAASRVEAARSLVLDQRLPATAALLEQGQLDWARVAAVLGRTRDLPASTARAVEERLYTTPRVLGHGLTRFEHALDAALLAVDADAVEARRKRLRRGRRVGIHTAADGSAFFTAAGPAEAVVAAYNGIDAAARQLRGDGDPRTLDQLRFDLFVTASTSGSLPVPGHLLPVPSGCTPADSPADPPADPPADTSSKLSTDLHEPTPARPSRGTSSGPVRPEEPRATTGKVEDGASDRPWFSSRWPAVQVTVNVTVSAETLMGLTEDPGTVHGYGPIPAQAVRELVTDGVFRCVVTDGVHGTVLGVGRSTFTPGYTPGGRLRLLSRHAFAVCDVPGCEKAWWRCDLDHQVPYAEGGPTCSCNVRPLCRTHHRLKTAGLLVPVWSGPPGQPRSELRWVTRTGRAYSTDDTVRSATARNDPPVDRRTVRMHRPMRPRIATRRLPDLPRASRRRDGRVEPLTRETPPRPPATTHVS